ncbi:D-alanyl-D-alanine carboxypeptidase family protein [Acetivibrio clariflavus]|uniref:serine-type D-Ala-D-Ala carboxypeptidase n=1 Tax=Acetivibrio clariflavus (strain DSM 19732 / NBRC 101661 / EBR45) TaxID=720554 RepID=G8LU99_ACECE|nr:D-alanyl-D-alanine carboxypeptidase family protein [Acetivibrio clariflavus]AEV69531.1 D-alanyl-D-alanine carboxypeptidase [Acetivibrio clariflavus DSM 19732]
MKNRFLIKVQCFLIVLLIIFVNGGQVFAAIEPPEVQAASAILVESKRGQILFEKNSRNRLHIASANKLMTALLALEKAGAKLDTQVTISKNVTEVEGLKMNLEVGAKYSVEDLVYTIILTSGNDSAIALAEYVGGDVKTFVDMMNKKAHELKLKDTNFTNPTGLYDEAQYTTAYDLAVLLRYALSNPAFDRIFSTEAKLWTNQNKVEIITNSNSLFWRYDGIDGGKTGYNDLERQTAITTATRNNMRIISIVLDSPEEYVYEDSIKLLDYGFENFKTGILVKKEQIIDTMTVEGKTIDLISPIDVYYTFPVGEYYIKNIDIKIKENIELPVLKTQVVGAVKYILKDDTEINVDLYPAVNVYSSVDMFSSLVKSMIEYKEITILLLILIWIEIFLILLKLLRAIKKVILKLKSKAKS